MSPLDHGHLFLNLEERVPIPPVLNLELEDSKLFRCSETVLVSGCLFVLGAPWLLNTLKKHLIVWVKHPELQLDIIC